MTMWLYNIVNTDGAPTRDNTEVWVSIIVTIGVVISAVAGAVATVYSRRTERRVTSLDKSVNGVPEGTAPLVQRVGTLERRQDSSDRWLTDALKRIGDQLGVHLPDRREYDQQGES